MDRPHGLALARSACGFWEVEQYLRARFNRWSEGGVWQRIFAALADDPDFEYLILDSTIVRAHQHAAGAKGGLKIRPSAARAAA
jgi:transposase